MISKAALNKHVFAFLVMSLAGGYECEHFIDAAGDCTLHAPAVGDEGAERAACARRRSLDDRLSIRQLGGNVWPHYGGDLGSFYTGLAS